MDYFGIYAQHLLKFGGGKFVLNDGIRLQTVQLESTIADNSFLNLPVTQMEQKNTAITGNLGMVYLANKNSKLSAGFSSGFRAPNIDDLARILKPARLTNGSLFRILISSQNTLTILTSITAVLWWEKLRVEAGGFYTLFRDAIAVAPYQFKWRGFREL
jgi:hemoglobin/transferrin/lactoferrin receptor protein